LSDEGISFLQKGNGAPSDGAVNSAQLICLSFWHLLGKGASKTWRKTPDPGGKMLEISERRKAVAKMLEMLKDEWVLVEGLRDKKALSALGITKVLTVSGNLRQSCDKLSDMKAERAYVLTDLDRRGYQLALMARDELEARSIRADLTVRGELAYALGIKNSEGAAKAYDKLNGD
jgi:5S rRNA maturation endonuclease (ribonuclease M5)